MNSPAKNHVMTPWPSLPEGPSRGFAMLRLWAAAEHSEASQEWNAAISSATRSPPGPKFCQVWPHTEPWQKTHDFEVQKKNTLW